MKTVWAEWVGLGAWVGTAVAASAAASLAAANLASLPRRYDAHVQMHVTGMAEGTVRGADVSASARPRLGRSAAADALLDTTGLGPTMAAELTRLPSPESRPDAREDQDGERKPGSWGWLADSTRSGTAKKDRRKVSFERGERTAYRLDLSSGSQDTNRTERGDGEEGEAESREEQTGFGSSSYSGVRGPGEDLPGVRLPTSPERTGLALSSMGIALRDAGRAAGAEGRAEGSSASEQARAPAALPSGVNPARATAPGIPGLPLPSMAAAVPAATAPAEAGPVGFRPGAGIFDGRGMDSRLFRERTPGSALAGPAPLASPGTIFASPAPARAEPPAALPLTSPAALGPAPAPRDRNDALEAPDRPRTLPF